MTGSASRSQAWTLDALGNWSSASTNGAPEGWTHNKQNQVTQIGSSDPAEYDANGNLLYEASDVETEYAYDAWNRLVVVSAVGVGEVAYTYDALGRRTKEAPSGGTARDLYHSDQWQVIEEREGSTVKAQNVCPVYVDAMVLRDRDAERAAATGWRSGCTPSTTRTST